MKRNREEKAVIAKRRKGPGKIFLPIILAMIFFCSLTAFANQNITLSERVNEINVREKGSIEIELTDGGENISKEGVVFRYAKVADIKDGQYVLKEQYKNCGVDLNQISYAKELDEAAEKLSYYGESDGDCITNEEGIAKIEDLDVGVYLLYVSEQKNYEKVMPVLIAVPTWEEEEGMMLYNVKVFPKHTPITEERIQETKKQSSVKTGDSLDVWIWLTGMVVAIGITGVVLRIKNKKE